MNIKDITTKVIELTEGSFLMNKRVFLLLAVTYVLVVFHGFSLNKALLDNASAIQNLAQTCWEHEGQELTPVSISCLEEYGIPKEVQQELTKEEIEELLYIE